MTARASLSILLVCALSGATLAQAEVPSGTDSITNARELLAGLDSPEERLCREYGFGAYFGGRANLGNMVVSVSPAKEPGAVYRVETNATMAMGPVKMAVVEVTLLDGSLALVRRHTDETKDSGEGQQSSISYVQVEEGVWKNVEVEDEQESTLTLERTAPDHSDLATGILIAHILPLDVEATYELQGINWNRESEAEATYAPLVLEVSVAEPYDFRGTQVEAHRVRCQFPDGDTGVMFVHAERGLLEIRPDIDAPVSMIAGTAEEITRDIEKPAPDESVVAGAQPLDTVRLYLDVVARVAEPDTLDAIVDWEAIRRGLIEQSPEVESLTAEQVAGIVKTTVSNPQAGVNAESADLVFRTLVAEIDGDKAEVPFPATTSPFRLEKRDGGWWIVALPQ